MHSSMAPTRRHRLAVATIAVALPPFCLFTFLTASPAVVQRTPVQDSSNKTQLTSTFWVYEFWGKVRKSGYCEPVRMDGAVQEPINSWSNYAYVLVGTGTIFLALGDLGISAELAPVYSLRAHPAFACLLGLHWAALGWCSFLFHAAHVTAFWILDIAFTNAAAAALLAWSVLGLAFSLRSPTRPRLWVAAMAAVLVLLDAIFIAYKRQMSAVVTLSSLIGLLIALEVIIQPLLVGKTRRQAGLTAAALGMMLLAFLVRNAETDKAWGRPLCLYSRWFQPHSVWHVCSAIAIALQLASFRAPFPLPLPRLGRGGLSCCLKDAGARSTRSADLDLESAKPKARTPTATHA